MTMERDRLREPVSKHRNVIDLLDERALLVVQY